jgi:formylglycine-generating enzyme required for sulfatase activity
MPYRAFVSSTYIDLKDHRAHVIRELRRSGFSVDPMEDWTADTDEPKFFSQKRVHGCDLCILLVALRRGHVPKGETKSITQLEYEAAKAAGIDILVYMLDEDAAWPRKFDELDKDPEIRKWRQELKEYRGIGSFALDPKSIEIAPALTRWMEALKSTGKAGKGGKRIDISGSLSMPQSYADWIIKECQHLEVERLCIEGGSGRIRAVKAMLPDLFIPLYASPPGQTKRGRRPEEEKTVPVNIEELIAKNSYLLIEGQAGSGKTTQLRHAAYSLVKGPGINGLEGYLPVLIFLRDVKEILDKRCRSLLNAEDLLSNYFALKSDVLRCEDIIRFCRANRTLFLVDGLDELPREYREKVIGAFSDFGAKHALRIVYSGRPNSFAEADRKYGDKHITILDLKPEQVKEFIDKWFLNIYSEDPEKALDCSKSLLSDMTGNSTFKNFLYNPLMLTGICLLYYSEKRLPNQRAELYKKLIENIVSGKFSQVEMQGKANAFLMSLAFGMQERNEKAAYKAAVLDAWKTAEKRKKGEDDFAYDSRIEKTFGEIEPKCGILKIENGKYSFWHNTFQEFLSARYIMINNPHYDEGIAGYWEKENFQEVIKLFIGFLSIDNPEWALKIIKGVIDERNASQGKTMLAAESLVDVRQDKRGEDLVQAVSAKLWSVIGGTRNRKTRAGAGEIIGALGDARNLQEFVAINPGKYKLQDLCEVELKAFEIGRYPVTNQWYDEFMENGGYAKAEFWSHEGCKWLENNKEKHPRFWYERNWRCPNSPVVGVTWWEADAFCRWLTKTRGDGKYRLPTEEEWQAAAAGFEGREFPWGNEFDAEKCNCYEGDGKVEKTSPVGIFKGGNTPDGVADMVGNVWEWCRSAYDEKKTMEDFPWDQEVRELVNKDKWSEAWELQRKKGLPFPVLRGGCWGDDLSYLRCAFRVRGGPNLRIVNSGFRCVR